jgi:hypothetical protein
MSEPHSRGASAFTSADSRTRMKDFNRKAEEASARVNKSVGDAAEALEKESAELIAYLNNEVVPAVRQRSTQALRVAAEKIARLADYMEKTQHTK